MKILHYSDEYGGTSTTFIRTLIRKQSEHHHLVFLCNWSVHSDEVDPVIRLVTMPFKRKWPVRRVYDILWRYDIACDFGNKSYKLELQKLLAEFRPDIIHLHFAYEGLKVYDNAGPGNYRYVFHFHGYDASKLLLKKSYVRRLRHIAENDTCSAVYCSSDMERRLNGHGVYFRNHAVIPYGIDTARFCMEKRSESGNLEREDKTFTFIQVATFREKKGHIYTLEAFRSLIHRRGLNTIQLVLIGFGPLEAKLKAKVKEWDLEGKVIFAGSMNSEMVKESLSRADAFVHHSITAGDGDMEGMPNAIIEAMAMGLPVVSTYHAGIPELVLNGVNGLLVPERDAAAMEEAMWKIMSWDKSTRNRNRILEHFSQDRYASDVEKFYKRIMEEHELI